MGQAESSFSQGCDAYDKGHYDDAAELMRETMDANPEHLDAKVNLGECQRDQLFLLSFHLLLFIIKSIIKSLQARKLRRL